MESITIAQNTSILESTLKSIKSLVGHGAPVAAPNEASIREKAYLLWEQAGQPEGDGVEFWLQAERELSAT